MSSVLPTFPLTSSLLWVQLHADRKLVTNFFSEGKRRIISACWVVFSHCDWCPARWVISHLHVCCFMGKLNALRPRSNPALNESLPYMVCWSHNSINQAQSGASLSTTCTRAPCKSVLLLKFHTPLKSLSQWDGNWSTDSCCICNNSFQSYYNSCYFNYIEQITCVWYRMSRLNAMLEDKDV